MRLSYVTPYHQECVKDWQLVMRAVGGPVDIWHLCEKRGYRMVRILFHKHPDQIILAGSAAPGRNGLISDPGYDMDWWIRDNSLSQGYLCSKFLRKQYVQAAALEFIRERAAEEGRAKQNLVLFSILIRRLKDARSQPGSPSDVTRTSESFAIWHENTFGGCSDNYAYDYVHEDAGWLCTIQQRFRELYLEYIRQPDQEVAS